MIRREDSARRLVIVGGGITGLSAAWYAQQANLPYVLLEGDVRWGGKIRSDQIGGFGDPPFTVEYGPDALLTRKPWALALARELGLDDQIIGVNKPPHQTLVLHSGRLLPLPDGLSLLVPSKLGPFLRSPLFSPRGKLRVLWETFVPPKYDLHEDETLAAFVRRRLGDEALDRLAEPLLAGVYNANADQQSIRATFPQFPDMESKYGSLLKAARAAKPPSSTSPDVPAFISFRGGIQTLVDTLVSRLTGDLRLRSSVRSIERLERGYKIMLANGDPLDADGLILATPAYVTAQLLERIAPDAARSLAAIRHSSIGVLSLAFRRDDVPHPLDAFGVVIPGSEGRRIDGITFSSSKWPARAPDRYALLRVFFGGPHSAASMTLDDDALITVVRDELQSILGISASPIFTHLHRWRDAYPQYDVGHLGRVARAYLNLPPGVFIAGSAYEGIGVPDCIRQGKEAVEKVLSAEQKAS